MEEAGSVWGLIKWYLTAFKQAKPIYRRALREEWEAAKGAEAVIYHPKAVGGFHIAEALEIPGFMAALLPAFVPTTAFPNPVLPRLSLGGWYNRLTYQTVTKSYFTSVVAGDRCRISMLPTTDVEVFLWHEHFDVQMSWEGR